MADPLQMRAREKRLADALRSNLKRRKEQARDRSAAVTETASEATDTNTSTGDAASSVLPDKV